MPAVLCRSGKDSSSRVMSCAAGTRLQARDDLYCYVSTIIIQKRGREETSNIDGHPQFL